MRIKRRLTDFTVTNVTVIDGTGSQAFTGAVAVSGDRITAVHRGRVPSVPPLEAGELIDGRGLALAPGFIDVHSHDDWALIDDPAVPYKILQGVTTVVTGNCGTSLSPEACIAHLPHSFPRMKEAFEALAEVGPAVNVASLVGHGGIRATAMGGDVGRPASAYEIALMAKYVEQAFDDGVIGLSSGLAYGPGRSADPAELITLGQIVANRGGIYTSHMRDEDQKLFDSIDETLKVGYETGCRVQISHLKAAGAANRGRAAPLLQRIEAAQAQGVKVAADQYPYTRGCTLLAELVDAGSFDGPSPFGYLLPHQVTVASCPFQPNWEGRTLAQIAAATTLEPAVLVKSMVAWAHHEECDIVVVMEMVDEADVKTVLCHPSVMIGTDGVAGGERPHPRLHHTFARVLGHYVRQLGLLDLEAAVHKMTGQSAEHFNLIDRGMIRPGAFADLVLFDPATIGVSQIEDDDESYGDPTSSPIGIERVWVNGVVAAEHGAQSSPRSGTILRRGV